MNNWQNYFKVVYHPNPGHYYVHCLITHVPVSDEYFLSRSGAEAHAKTLVDKKFEEMVLND